MVYNSKYAIVSIGLYQHLLNIVFIIIFHYIIYTKSDLLNT